jgi:hypothetical protein
MSAVKEEVFWSRLVGLPKKVEGIPGMGRLIGDI